MVSAWWIVLAFFGGGFAGILVIALMRMSSDLPEQSAQVPDLNATPW